MLSLKKGYNSVSGNNILAHFFFIYYVTENTEELSVANKSCKALWAFLDAKKFDKYAGGHSCLFSRKRTQKNRPFGAVSGTNAGNMLNVIRNRRIQKIFQIVISAWNNFCTIFNVLIININICYGAALTFFYLIIHSQNVEKKSTKITARKFYL